MNTREAAIYLLEKHGLNVMPEKVSKWLAAGHVDGKKISGRWDTTEAEIDSAIERTTLPPKVGRRRTFTKRQRQQMRDMCERHTLRQVAKHFGCDPSYVSLIRRGKR